MAAAPFTPALITVPRRDRGYSYQGQTLGARADSLTYHLIKRVVIEEQWARGTTAAEYVADLHAAVAESEAQLALYAYGIDVVAATLTPREQSIPASHLGPRPEALVLVVYSANRGALTTGYQVSSVAATSVPAEARWLS
jgi:hypothetical protein